MTFLYGVILISDEPLLSRHLPFPTFHCIFYHFPLFIAFFTISHFSMHFVPFSTFHCIFYHFPLFIAFFTISHFSMHFVPFPTFHCIFYHFPLFIAFFTISHFSLHFLPNPLQILISSLYLTAAVSSLLVRPPRVSVGTVVNSILRYEHVPHIALSCNAGNRPHPS